METGIEILDQIISTVMPQIGSNIIQIVIFTIAIAIYGIIIFHFYRFVARKDVFGFNLREYLENQQSFFQKFTSTIWGMIAYGLLFPFFVFLWFAGFALLLFFMSKTTSIDHILLVSITVVSAIRITSYYSEDLSKDLAKMLPFALLGIAMIDPSFFSMSLVWQRVDEFMLFLPKIVAFALISIILEWILRIVLFFKRSVFGIKVKKSDLQELSEK